jgi:hypothetical protein
MVSRKLDSSIIKNKVSRAMLELLEAPKSQDPLEKLAHELFVSDMVISIAEKHKKAAVEDLMVTQVRIVDEVLKDTEKMDKGGSYPFCSTPSYQVTINTRKPSFSIDKAALKVNLCVDLGLSLEDADKFIDKSSKKSAVPKGLKAEPLT